MPKEKDPILKKLQELGCNSQFKLAIAYQVYLDLSEVRKLQVESRYNKELDIIYFVGKGDEFPNGSEIFIPLSSASFLSMSWIETLQQAICQDREGPRITMAFKEQDSSVMYYCMTTGIIPPDPPSPPILKKPGQLSSE
ncbi:Uncharacterized protein GBIM_08756 [Gryllus bimaculatus]|nr:Uncharacterized protein GBIM_08756 [Gryllus bimaculatus]